MTMLFSDGDRQESAGNCSERIREYSSPIVTKYVQEILLRPGLGILFDKFKFQEHTDLREITRNVSGIIQSNTFGNSLDRFFIREFEQRTFLQDGFRDPNAQIRETANIERVEVLKGSASILYGELQPDFMKERLEGVKALGWPEANLETILSLEPDVILSTKGSAGQIYDQLSQIAPTVLVKGGSGNWKSRFRVIAEALGKTERAEQLMSEYQQRTEQLQAQLGTPQNRPEVSVVNVRADRIRLYLKDTFCGLVLQDAGLPRPPSQDSEGTVKNISLESIETADGDVMFLWTYGSGGAKSALADLKAEPLWSKLDVVQRDQVYEVPEYWIGSGPISANLVLDDLFKYLVEKS